jgi:N-ethylmaleimide reductase
MSSSAEDPANGVLFQSAKVGRLDLPHRVVMAPLTRSRSQQPGNIPTSLNACYYAQRASAALIISEATQVSQQGQGYAWTPGIHTADQVAGWQLVTDAAHEAGGRIFSQLWHVGRVSHPSLQPDGMLPVAPSAIAPSGEAFVEAENGGAALVPFVPPRALQLEEMPYVVQQFERGARNALTAGFDGVEVHAANGYLLDQFLNSTSNRRTDDYGGSVENRARLLLEVIEAAGEVWGSDRVGVRLSPLGTFNDMGDEDPEATFGHVVERLNGYGLAYLHVVRRFKESEDGTEMDPEAGSMMRLIRDAYKGRLMVAGGFELDEAEEWLRTDKADLIAFGRKFLANPDLPERFRLGVDLNVDDPTTYYGGDGKGYTDYPTLDQEKEGTEPIPCVDTRWR